MYKLIVVVTDLGTKQINTVVLDYDSSESANIAYEAIGNVKSSSYSWYVVKTY